MDDFLSLVFLYTMFTFCYCQPFPPVVVDDTDSTIILSEATPIGTVIRTISARDDDGDDVTINYPEFDSDSKILVIINQTKFGPDIAHADLILNMQLDRDYNPELRKLHFIIKDTSVNNFEITVVIDLIITDVNDEVPVFQNVPYRLDLREDHPSMRIVHTNISARDPDNGVGGLVTYSMEPITQSTQDAVLFMNTFSIGDMTGEVFLKASLDYEELQFFQFTVTASDGHGLNSTEVLTIRVLDLQDTSPQFQGTPYVVTVTENLPTGSHFFTIRALDGDRGVPNDVLFYFISGHCLTSFAIDNTTGEVTVSRDVDRDSGDVMDNGGVCEIRIRVTEVETNFPQLGASSAETTLSVFVMDQNDNRPSFNMDTYNAYIQDTAQLNYPLQFENKTEIHIQDRDQGSSGILEIILRGQDGDITYDFEPIPSVIASQGRPLITLKSPGLLITRKEIILKIYAVERDTPDTHSAIATINIRVLNIATTTMSTTTVKTTTPFYDDPFIPSILGVVLPAILLIWAAVATCYYCMYNKRVNNNNRVGHHDFQNGNGHANPQTPRKNILPPINAEINNATSNA